MNDQLLLDLPGELPFAPRSMIATAKCILRSVCCHFGVPSDVLLSRTRTARVAEARQAAMTLIRRNTDFSLVEVGEIFRRDHATVIHAMRAVDRKAEVDADFAAILAGVMMEIRSRETSP